jgi:hypothetical protein
MSHAKMNEDFKDHFIRSFLVKEDNLYHAEKMFMAYSVLKWVFDQKVPETTRAKYFNHIDRYLSNEIDLYWEDGTIKYRTIKADNRGKK